MKITFFSNFLNHHQKELCDELYKRLGQDFCFVATSAVPAERLSMGYHDMNKMEIPYLLMTYSSEESRQHAMSLAISSDAIIWGSAPPVYYLERMKYNRLTFVYSERIWRKGIGELKNLRKIASYFYHHTRFRNNNSYLLCNSSYTAGDFLKVGAYRHKAFKWGYFPTTKRYESVDQIISNKKRNTILWAGRMVEGKHPEMAIEAAYILKNEGYSFQLKFIGNGEMRSVCENLVKSYELGEYVSFCDSMPPENVREEMERSLIYLFTSDYSEGWGAVLNEAMNSACAVVASKAAGATAYLINDMKNGMIYDYNNIGKLTEHLRFLLDNYASTKLMGMNAYRTIVDEWNAGVAAERIIELSLAILDNNEKERQLFLDGPCSPA